MEATFSTEKAMNGIKQYLKRRGMDILEEGWAHGKDSVDFIAKDEDTLVFVSSKIRASDKTDLGTDNLDRKASERIATAYLKEHQDMPESYVRLDIVSMLIISENKAFLRHHRNALGVDSSDLD